MAVITATDFTFRCRFQIALIARQTPLASIAGPREEAVGGLQDRTVPAAGTGRSKNYKRRRAAWDDDVNAVSSLLQVLPLAAHEALDTIHLFVHN